MCFNYLFLCYPLNEDLRIEDVYPGFIFSPPDPVFWVTVQLKRKEIFHLLSCLFAGFRIRITQMRYSVSCHFCRVADSHHWHAYADPHQRFFLTATTDFNADLFYRLSILNANSGYWALRKYRLNPGCLNLNLSRIRNHPGVKAPDSQRWMINVALQAAPHSAQQLQGLCPGRSAALRWG